MNKEEYKGDNNKQDTVDLLVTLEHDSKVRYIPRLIKGDGDINYVCLINKQDTQYIDSSCKLSKVSLETLDIKDIKKDISKELVKDMGDIGKYQILNIDKNIYLKTYRYMRHISLLSKNNREKLAKFKVLKNLD